MRRAELTWSLVAPQDYSRLDWDRLDRTHLPMLDSEVVDLLLMHFGTGVETVAVCHKGASIVAMTIVARYRMVAWQTWQPPQQPLALWVHDESVALSSLMRTFVETQSCAMLSVTQLDPHFYPRASDIETFDCMRTAYVPVTTDFKTYWDARHNLKTNLKKQRNKLAREGVTTRLEAVVEVHKMREAVADYGRLESRGWKRVVAQSIRRMHKASFMQRCSNIWRGAVKRRSIDTSSAIGSSQQIYACTATAS
jgi:hypothetical protein